LPSFICLPSFISLIKLVVSTEDMLMDLVLGKPVVSDYVVAPAGRGKPESVHLLLSRVTDYKKLPVRILLPANGLDPKVHER
jgi:hypothetical protein